MTQIFLQLILSLCQLKETVLKANAYILKWLGIIKECLMKDGPKVIIHRQLWKKMRKTSDPWRSSAWSKMAEESLNEDDNENTRNGDLRSETNEILMILGKSKIRINISQIYF